LLLTSPSEVNRFESQINSHPQRFRRFDRIRSAIPFPNAANRMPTFVSLSNFSTQDLESWREVFNFLLIVSTLAVCIGVYFEKDENPEDVKECGFGLVFRGIAFEFLFAILLWQVDSVVSGRLNSQIETLRADNLALEAQIAPRRLKPDDCTAVAAAVATFSGRQVRIDTYSLDLEGGILGWQIASCMDSAHTVEVDRGFASILPLGGFGVGIFVSGNDEPLVASIRDVLSKKANLLVVPGNGFSANNIRSVQGDPARPAPAANVLIGVRPPADMK
jgi:hypothetical protein